MIKIKNKKLRFVITFLAVLLSALLQTFVIESFVQTAGLLSGGVLPVVSVKTASDIPKGKIKDVMEAIRQIHAVAPVQIGDVLLHDAAGTGADIVATKNIPVATGFREN